MVRQLFDNISRPDLRTVNRKTERYLVMVSVLFHIVVVMILITFFATTTGPTYIPKQIVVFSGPVYFNFPKSPPPPLPPKRKLESKKTDKTIEKPLEHDSLIVPIEVPNEIKPEPPKESEENLPDNTKDVSDDSLGEKGRVPGDVPGGVVGQPPPDYSPSLQVPVETKKNVDLPKRTKYVHPTYPFEARMARVEGVVIVEAIIGKNGKIKSAKIIQSVPFLDLAALEAVKKWEYKPRIIDGEAIETVLTVIIKFELT